MKHLSFLFLFFFAITSPAGAQPVGSASGFNPYYSGGLQAGYNDGLGIQLTGTMSGFAQEFPFSLRACIAYTFLNPGSPLDARKIFINDNTNGTPEKNGHSWDLRLDFMLPANFITHNSYIFFGPRYSMFTGNFNFIGGNEFFSVISNQFGLGAGVETAFRINHRMNFVISGGADYYFDSNLAGHDTEYNPDGEHINPRDYSYEDADEAIDQPKIEFRLMTGINYYF